MAFSASKVHIVGNLAADVELRDAGGKSVCDLRICANVYRGKDKDETPVWYKATLWERYAEVMAPSLKKGMKIYVDGDLVVEEYEKKDGGTGYSLVILQPNVIVLAHGEKTEGAKRSDSGRKTFPFPRD